MWPLLAATAVAMLCAAREPRPRRGGRRRTGGRRGRTPPGLPPGRGGAAFGIGAALALGALTVCLARAIARRGFFNGDATVATIVVVIAALLLLFIFFPVGKSLLSAVLDASGRFAPGLAVERLFTADIWWVDCLRGGTRCGVAVNSALLATIVGVLSTLLGLVLALVVQRGGQRYAGLLKADVDPADHHAAVRDRAGAGRAVRPHRSCHRLARGSVRHRRARAGSTGCRA